MALRSIPSIDELSSRPVVRDLERRYGRRAVIDALRDAAASLRDEIRRGPAPSIDTDEAARSIEQDAALRLARRFRPSLRPVINATGVVLHTNLGRAPLARPAIDAIRRIASGYSNLEFDLDAGRRGRRDVHAEALLCRMTGAGAALVVNNNAAAALLVLAAVAAGREVLVSRGELVEIGGGFRVPDVMTQSGAVLREVGTTNRTRTADYAAAIGDRTALILRVHRSNFRIEGFTERPSLQSLVDLGRRFGIPVAEDLGSGNLIDSPPVGAPERAGLDDGEAAASSAPGAAFQEPTVGASLQAGVSIVFFSGDKLLGGPQAGVIVGARDLIERIRAHPLVRALRVDKLTYGALEATLLEYASGRARATVPVAAMLSLSPAAVDERARAIVAAAGRPAGLTLTLADGASTIGGGSAPGVSLPTRLIVLGSSRYGADALVARLRSLSPPVIARIEQDRVVLDVRTVLPEQDAELAALLGSLELGGPG